MSSWLPLVVLFAKCSMFFEVVKLLHRQNIVSEDVRVVVVFVKNVNQMFGCHFQYDFD